MRKSKIVLDSDSLDNCEDKIKLSIYNLNSRKNSYKELENQDFKYDIVEEFDANERKSRYRGSVSHFGNSHGIYCGQFYDDLPFPNEDDYYDNYYDNDYSMIGEKRSKSKSKKASRREKLLNTFFPSVGKKSHKYNSSKKSKLNGNDIINFDTMEKWIYFYDDYENMSSCHQFTCLKDFKDYLDENGINLSETEENMIKYWTVVHATFNPSDKEQGILSVISDTSQGKLYESCADIEYSYQLAQSNKSSDDLPF